MDNIKLMILNYYFDNGKVELTRLSSHFKYDLTPQQFKDSLNYLIGKKYLTIIDEGTVYELTDLGRQTIIDLLEQQEVESKRQSIREQLEVENLKLQNDSIKYQNSIRDKQNEIDNLTIINLKLQNRQLKRYILYSFIGFIGGIMLTNYHEIWIALKLVFQK